MRGLRHLSGMSGTRISKATGACPEQCQGTTSRAHGQAVRQRGPPAAVGNVASSCQGHSPTLMQTFASQFQRICLPCAPTPPFRYMPYLENLFNVPRKWLAWLEGGQKLRQLLTTCNNNGRLYYSKISGNTNAAIVSQAAFDAKVPNMGLHILFELKKQVEAANVLQALCQLLLANIHSTHCKPILVLTDLGSSWYMYWMDGMTIKGGACSSASAALVLVQAAVAAAAAAEAATAAVQNAALAEAAAQQANVYLAGPAVPHIVSERQPLPESFVASAPDVGNIAELEGMLPEEEYKEAVAETWLGMLRRMPLFHGLQPSPRMPPIPPEPAPSQEPPFLHLSA